jgi:TolB protein
MLPESQIRHELQPHPSFPYRSRLVRLGVLSLSSILLFLVSFIATPKVPVQVNALDETATTISGFSQPEPTFLSPTATLTATRTPVRLVLPPQRASIQAGPAEGTIFLSIQEGGFSHLFAFHPTNLPLTRLTNGPWDDAAPALSPDGLRLAFASNRSGVWDLYLLELATGKVERLTDTPQYDSAPSWSPDGRYLVYETYGADLEIAIHSIFDDQPEINLSQHPAADFEPAWSPGGRQIAFLSTRTGEREVWLADLDRAGEERFVLLSSSPGAYESHLAWSPDGSALVWSAVENGYHSLHIWKNEGTGQATSNSSSSFNTANIPAGDWPAWSPDGGTLLTALEEPNRTLLVGYSTSDGLLALPPLALPGPVTGIDWSYATLPGELPAPLAEAALATPEPAWKPDLSQVPDAPNGRHRLVELEDVAAPYPLLHDLVVEAFNALREHVAWGAGWDFLASLENAFVPLTSPLPPGMGEDWLYTGRAFAFNPVAVNSGWVVVVPEQFASQTYWRIYLKARHQDGRQGAPLRDRAWDFYARYGGDPLTYEAGGRLTPEIPPGYWIDFTALAGAYGWERLPALSTWRSAYFTARFNEFVFAEGQSWRQSMLELYPPEALITPTAAPPPTLTPTPTPWWRSSP